MTYSTLLSSLTSRILTTQPTATVKATRLWQWPAIHVVDDLRLQEPDTLQVFETRAVGRVIWQLDVRDMNAMIWGKGQQLRM